MNTGKYIDADIVRLRQMYLEEKVNSNKDYVFLENGIWRLTQRRFLDGKFLISCPENFEEIAHNGVLPFSVLRTPYKSMALSLYEVLSETESEGSIIDSFTRLFPENLVDESGDFHLSSCKVRWFDYRQTVGGAPFYHQIFSAEGEAAIIIGHMHTRMKEYERAKNLMRRLLNTIEFSPKEEDIKCGK